MVTPSQYISNGFKFAARSMCNRDTEAAGVALREGLPARAACEHAGKSAMTGPQGQIFSFCGYKKKQRGFTLIELLFMLALIGALSTAGILFYQQRMQNQKIEKTVMQIEQWMQAGVLYYSRNNKVWPTNAQTLIDQQYMPPNAANKNPWCEEKEGTVPGTCYSVGIDPEEPQLFAVTARIASGDPTVRDAIVGRLPYARKIGDNFVTALINAPEMGNDQGAILAGIEVLPELVHSNANFTPVGSGSQRYFVSRDISIPRNKVNCNQYGDAYELDTHPTITRFSTDDNPSNNSSPTISMFSIEKRQGDPFSFKVLVRPQRYHLMEVTNCYLGRSWRPDPSCTDSYGAEPGFESTLKLVVTVLFVCKKKTLSEEEISTSEMYNTERKNEHKVRDPASKEPNSKYRF